MRDRFASGPLGERLDLVGFGEVMVLLQPDPPQTLADSESWRVHVAGAEFNACAAASVLGAQVGVCTRLGDDPPAARVRRYAEARRVGMDAVVDVSAPTGLFLKDALPDGERRVHYYRAGSAASRMDAPDAQRGLRASPRAILISGLTAALGDGPARAVLHAAELAHDAGAAVVLDVNLRPALGRVAESAETVARLLPLADLVVVGRSDGDTLFGTAAPEGIARTVRDAGAREVVVTAGADGCWWQDGDAAMRHQQTLAEVVVDPVGAGDAFVGGYVAARLHGLTPRGAAWLGSALSAHVVATAGDTAGLPSHDDGPGLLARAAAYGGLAA